MVVSKGVLVGNKVLIEDATSKGRLLEKGFGENKGKTLVLDVFEGLFLLLQGKLVLVDAQGKNVSQKTVVAKNSKKDSLFYSKLLVVSDLRSKGYCVKTGLKFGFDFRVYPLKKKVGEAHSEFVVQVMHEHDKVTLTQVSRMVRLAGNINLALILAVVDGEDKISYFEFKRRVF